MRAPSTAELSRPIALPTQMGEPLWQERRRSPVLATYGVPAVLLALLAVAVRTPAAHAALAVVSVGLLLRARRRADRDPHPQRAVRRDRAAGHPLGGVDAGGARARLDRRGEQRRRDEARVRRTRVAVAAAVGAGLALVGCGGQESKPPVALPASGRAYNALPAARRLAVAESCRDRAAARARGTAARELRAIDARALRAELDDAFTIIPDERRPVAEVCAQRLPFVTPGMRLRFAGARGDGAGRFTYETNSDVPLTIRGRTAPASRGGRVVATRETGGHGRYVATIDASGRFVVPHIRLRKIADNTFTVTIDAPPNAPHKVHFSAICLDCLAGAPPPAPR